MKTLFDKIWDQHLVKEIDAQTQVLSIDRHYIHEVTSPQAFEMLKQKGDSVMRPDLTTATADHNVPTKNQNKPVENELSKRQLDALTENCKLHGIELFGLGHENNGIVHVIGPELGLTQPGMTIVCGDSHTSTHGAFGTIAFGIGTSQVAQVLASQSVLTAKPKTLLIRIDNQLNKNITSKDLILHIIKELGSDYGTGYFVEFGGEGIQSLSMEGRMTVCNMSIEMGARGGLIAPDEKTFDYLKSKKYSQHLNMIDFEYLVSDSEKAFDKVVVFDAKEVEPTLTFGTNPGMGVGIDQKIKTLTSASFEKSIHYMGLQGRKSLKDLPIQHVFIGSCTNGRFEDFKAAAAVIKGKQKSKHVRALLVPGSNAVLEQIKSTGLMEVFTNAGFEIRQPGCSACLAMNGDTVPEGEYCVSTSNRNFEGRQGAGARTILASPVMAAAAAIAGKIINPN
ncbi:MAG: 3-isopropylmalate dehydratase large subunit [Crocinitomicaceae bacterium]